MCQLLGHVALGALQVTLIMLAIDHWTGAFEDMDDHTYMLWFVLVGIGGGGILGAFPDLYGGLIGNMNWDDANPIPSSLCGGHWLADHAYACYGIQDFSLADDIVCMLIFILMVVIIVVVLGLTDSAQTRKPSIYEEDDPEFEAKPRSGRLKK